MSASCSGRRVVAPQLNAEDTGKRAIAEYDRNKDGFLDAAELERCPALKSCHKSLDTNKDGRLSAEEIAARITAYQASRLGQLAFPCLISLDGTSLAGATVEFVPEKFLGGTLKSARGVSDSQGQVTLQIEGQSVAGVACGFYRVVITRAGPAGKETLPERYNVKTILGQEIGPDLQGTVRFDLTSQ